VRYDGSYGVPASIAMNGLTLTPFVIGDVKATHPKYKLLHFGFEPQWQNFRSLLISRQIVLHCDTPLPEELKFKLFTTCSG
jgi:hypothetical protein